MRDTDNDYKNIWKGVGIFAVAMVVIFLVCCTPSKKTQGYTKDVYDSLYVKELEEEVKILQIENGELTSRIGELEFLGVEFNPDCDSILKEALLKAGCNEDSINVILNAYKSKVKLYADGSLEAEGFIKSLRRSKEKNEEIISKYQHTIDSLRQVKQKEINWLQKEVVTKTVTKKRGIYWWLWVLIGYGICILLPPQRVWQYIKIGVTKLPFRK